MRASSKLQCTFQSQLRQEDQEESCQSKPRVRAEKQKTLFVDIKDYYESNCNEKCDDSGNKIFFARWFVSIFTVRALAHFHHL
jgi:hypothetical protein